MVEINSDRLLDDLRHLRSFGTYKTGVKRPAFSSADMAARRWLHGRMMEAGLQASVDGVANVIGHSPNQGKAVLIGSHTDSQPVGGWLDGTLGVVYGLEVARSCLENERTSRLPIDVASWSDEEGIYLGMLGSRSFCGMLSPGEVKSAHNYLTGMGLTEAIGAAGLEDVPVQLLQRQRYCAYLEAHIEQGPKLYSENLQLGVVNSIVAIRGFKFTFLGQQNHAGTTPMRSRRDAAMTLIKLASAIDQAFSSEAGADTVWTFGRLLVEPGSPNIVPGRAELFLEYRGTDEELLHHLETMIFSLVEETGRTASVKIRAEQELPRMKPALMNREITDHLAAAAELHGPGTWRRMDSGAAHDAQILAGNVPSGMLFIPSIRGISHDIAEDSNEDDIIRGCRVMADAVVSILGNGAR